MKYKLPRQLISEKLILFTSKMVRQTGEFVPKAPKNILRRIQEISKKIEAEGLPGHLVKKKLPGKLGHGIFLHPKAIPIRKGEVIAPYAGEVSVAPQNHGEGSDYTFSLISNFRLTRKEQRHWDPKNKYHPARLYSIDLDAEKRGNFTRFINHSLKPNVEAQFLRVPSNDGKVIFEIVYVAKKAIRPGEQLLVCYEGEDKSYWGAMGIKPFPMDPCTFRLNSDLKLLTGDRPEKQKRRS